MMATRRIEPGPVGERVAQNLAELRTSSRLSQPQLAKILVDLGHPLAAAVLSKIEKRDRRVDVDDLVALAIALGVAPNRLLLTPAWDTGQVELTPELALYALDVWRWANGMQMTPELARYALGAETVGKFKREHDPYHGISRDTETGDHGSVPRLLSSLMAAADRGLSEEALVDLVHTAFKVRNGHNAGRSLTTAEGNLMPESAATVEPQPVAAAIVTSRLGVLAGRRNDGKPPWTFIAGEVEPGEAAPFAAVREVKEETGLEARAVSEIGRRVHPKTGRTMIYIAAEPARPDDLDVFVGDTDELAEVRWLSLAEADELLPSMFEPVHQHLERELGPATEG